MHRIVHLISRGLVAILLATVLSPSFGWQALEGMSTHEHGDDLHMLQSIDNMVVDTHDHAGCSGHDLAVPDSAHESVDHCCPGHVLGHLLGGVAADGLLPIPAEGSAGFEALASSFTSRIPEGLDRPPRHAA